MQNYCILSDIPGYIKFQTQSHRLSLIRVSTVKRQLFWRAILESEVPTPKYQLPHNIQFRRPRPYLQRQREIITAIAFSCPLLSSRLFCDQQERRRTAPVTALLIADPQPFQVPDPGSRSDKNLLSHDEPNLEHFTHKQKASEYRRPSAQVAPHWHRRRGCQPRMARWHSSSRARRMQIKPKP